ncbi:hypothetical protein ACFP9V_20310 [Deinococcus radiopugnans]|nr:carboxypeptidase-like regulatory domain-containing protein [Deinococcus radiopugnans]MBB6015396.1 hypothetical protein [Deinococcus radiopugnans ATCC 19172]
MKNNLIGDQTAERPEPRSRRSDFRPAVLAGTLALACGLGVLSVVHAAPVKAGTVQGQAVDHKGKPLAGLHVWIKPGLTTGVVDVLTGPDGRYRVDGLPYLPYTAHAWYPVTYKGQTYCYRLAHPSAAEYQPFNAQSGTTRNFRWQLSGKIPGVEDYKGTGFYGGTLALPPAAYREDMGSLEAEDRLEVTLTPVGPLIDGSPGKKLVLKTNEISQIYDVPVGTYAASAVAVTPAGARRPVLLAGEYSGQPAPSVTFTFEGLKAGESCVGKLSTWTATRNLYYFVPAKP